MLRCGEGCGEVQREDGFVGAQGGLVVADAQRFGFKLQAEIPSAKEGDLGQCGGVGGAQGDDFAEDGRG